MRIDQSGQFAQQLRQATAPQTQEFNPQRGEVINATVLGREGNAVLLQTEDGVMFQARVMSDAMLLPQDQVECMVSANGGGQISLQLLSITSRAPMGQEQAVSRDNPLLISMGLSGNASANSVLSALETLDIRPSAEMIAQAMTIMEEHGLSARDAVFFIANEIIPTQESVQAYLELKGGQNAGEALFALAQDAAALGGEDFTRLLQQLFFPSSAPAAQDAPQAQPGQMTQAAAQDVPAQEAMVLPQNIVAGQDAATPQAPQGNAQPPAMGGEALPPEAAAQEAVSQGVAQPEAQAPGQPGVQAPSQEAGQAQGQENLAPNLPGAQLPLDDSASLARRLLDFFMKLDGSSDGKQLQQAAEKAEQLSVLRETLRDAALPGKETLAARVADLASQAKVTQDVSRFVCMHIPIHHQGPDTAELYIYKQKRQDKGVDPENTSILLALNTQNLGRVETLMRVERRNVSLAFKVENEDALGLFKEESKALYGAFRAYNYVLTDTKVAPLAARTTPANAQEVLQQSVRREHRFLDYRI